MLTRNFAKRLASNKFLLASLGLTFASAYLEKAKNVKI
jgi:hypothetical protein